MTHHPLRAVTLAVLGALLCLSGLAAQHASADEPHAGLAFSIGVHGVPGCNTRASDVTCTLPAGQPFVLDVSLDALPDDIPSYKGYDLYVEYAGVTPGTDASTDVWPDCGFPVSFNGTGFVAWGCAIGVPPAGPSSWIGPIGTVTFTCTQSGSIDLRHSSARGYTDLIQDAQASPSGSGQGKSIGFAEGADTRETITINCASVPARTPGILTGGTPGGAGPTPQQAHPDITGPTATPLAPGQTLEPTAAAKATESAKARATATARAKPTPAGTTAGGDNGSSKKWVWIVIIIAGVAAVVIAGGGYWYVRNRAGGAGGSPPGSTPSGGTAP